MISPTSSVEFEKVIKRFDSVTAVDDLSFTVPEGTIYSVVYGVSPNDFAALFCNRLFVASSCAIVLAACVSSYPDGSNYHVAKRLIFVAMFPWGE
jgi:hypothetical protein